LEGPTVVRWLFVANAHFIPSPLSALKAAGKIPQDSFSRQHGGGDTINRVRDQSRGGVDGMGPNPGGNPVNVPQVPCFGVNGDGRLGL
jgi:hypothetical protein